jgi:hypothetical protein
MGIFTANPIKKHHHQIDNSELDCKVKILFKAKKLAVPQ